MQMRGMHSAPTSNMSSSVTDRIYRTDTAARARGGLELNPPPALSSEISRAKLRAEWRTVCYLLWEGPSVGKLEKGRAWARFGYGAHLGRERESNLGSNLTFNDMILAQPDRRTTLPCSVAVALQAIRALGGCNLTVPVWAHQSFFSCPIRQESQA